MHDKAVTEALDAFDHNSESKTPPNRMRAAIRAFLASVEISDDAIEAAYGAAEFDDRWHIEDGDDFKRAVKAMSAKLADELGEK